MLFERPWLTLGGSAAFLSLRCLTQSSCSPTLRHTATHGHGAGAGLACSTPAGTWSLTHLANAIYKLTRKAFELKHFTSHLPPAKSTHAASSAAQLRARNSAPGSNAPMLLNPWCDDICWVSLYYPQKCRSRSRRGRAESCPAHPIVVMYVVITFLPVFLDVPHKET